MSWLTKLLGADRGLDTVDNIIDKGAAGIGKLFFTAEEKSDASQKVLDSALKFQELNQDQNSIRSKVRRYMAIPLMANYIFLVDLAVYLYVFKGSKESAEYIQEILMGRYGQITLAVTVFYFGYPAVSNVVAKIKGK